MLGNCPVLRTSIAPRLPFDTGCDWTSANSGFGSSESIAAGPLRTSIHPFHGSEFPSDYARAWTITRVGSWVGHYRIVNTSNHDKSVSGLWKSYSRPTSLLTWEVVCRQPKCHSSWITRGSLLWLNKNWFGKKEGQSCGFVTISVDVSEEPVCTICRTSALSQRLTLISYRTTWRQKKVVLLFGRWGSWLPSP